MTTPRFFVDIPLAVGHPCTLPREATRHALRALRLRQGDRLTLFNGRGGEYAAQLVVAREPEAEAQVIAHDEREAELAWSMTIAQGLSSGDRMDWTVEKAVELGVATIVPLGMERSVTRLQGERADARRMHWRKIAIAASEQCGRNRVADIEPVVSLNDWLATLPEASMRIVLAGDGSSIAGFRAPPAGRRVLIVVGPEGGMTDNESKAIQDAGFHRLSLGPRILRTETAGPAALAMLSAYWHAN